MIPLLADENFRGDILAGLKRREPALDIVRVQDVGLQTKDDNSILEWAASQGRVLVTHDRGSMDSCVRTRRDQGLLVAGVVIVRDNISTGRAVEEILMIAVCSTPAEFQSTVSFIPM